MRTKVDQLQQRSILSTEKRKETLKLYDVSNYKKTEDQVSLHRPLNEENRQKKTTAAESSYVRSVLWSQGDANTARAARCNEEYFIVALHEIASRL